MKDKNEELVTKISEAENIEGFNETESVNGDNTDSDSGHHSHGDLHHSHHSHGDLHHNHHHHHHHHHNHHKRGLLSRLCLWIQKNKVLAMYIAIIGVVLIAAGIWGLYKYRERKAAGQQEMDQAMLESAWEAALLEELNNAHEIQVQSTENPDGTTTAIYTYDGVAAPGHPDIFSENHLIYNGRPYRRNTAIKVYLIMGIDSYGSLADVRDYKDVKQADVLFLIIHDTSKDSIKILEIPRNTRTLVSITFLGGEIVNQSMDAINLAWAFGDGHDRSAQFAEESLSYALGGLKVDGYMAGSMDAITILNDMVGGVKVTIDDPDMVNADPAFKEGVTLTLKGDQAERFIRYRNLDKFGSAIGRMDHHRQFAMEFEKRVLEMQKVDGATIRTLFESIQKNIVTDMEKGQYVRIAMDIMAHNQLLNANDFYRLKGIMVDDEVREYGLFYVDQAAMDETLLELLYLPVGE